ncbi:MAG: PorT family protein, partial [Pedobacter sp.]
MKTKLSLLLIMTMLVSASVFSQTTFGVRAGVNFTNFNGKSTNGTKIDNKLNTGFNAGVNAEIPIADEFFLQPGVLFSTKGARPETAGGYEHLSYIEVPVNFLYKPAVGTGHFLLGVGPYVAVAVGGQQEILGQKSDVPFGSDFGERRRFDAGANLLAGYEFSNRFSAQLNAGLGLLRINNRPPNDETST